MKKALFIILICFILFSCKSKPVTYEEKTSVVPQKNNMIMISAGTFTMGSPVNERDRFNVEGPQHKVKLNAFYLSIYEVTQKEFMDLMGFNNSTFKGDNYPVDMVSWYEAIEYCNALSRKEKLKPAYIVNKETVTWDKSANGYRLPTEAEWEYASRAGTTTAFFTGNNITTSQANYDGNWPYGNNPRGEYRKRFIEVGSLPGNPWGLYDMQGNAWEWCWDWFGNYSEEDQENPDGNASGATRVQRGGSWGSTGAELRSAFRRSYYPNERVISAGFRVARNGN
ncbi:MAG: formylglycine-generating enzyme family protein [Treponema sp.]|nr:formylglycine-generating enzyme family protein [Treponema sp.]